MPNMPPKWITLPLPLPLPEGEAEGHQQNAACELAPKGETPPAPAAEGMAAPEGMADVGQWAAGQIAMIGVSARARAMMQRRAERAAARAEARATKGKRRRAGGEGGE